MNCDSGMEMKQFVYPMRFYGCIGPHFNVVSNGNVMVHMLMCEIVELHIDKSVSIALSILA